MIPGAYRMGGWLTLLAVTLAAGLAAGPAASPDAESDAATQPGQPLPFITLNADEGYIDLEATVVMREGEWLELLACSPRSREHESILTVPAKPSHIHLALLMLGLEPGAPLAWEWTNQERGEYEVSPPRGPRVAVTILLDAAGPPREIPANEWIINQLTGEPMPDNVWLFAGSTLREHEGEPLYMADLNGSVITLVNFGDDLLARPTTLTNHNDGQAWNANTPRIPPLDTPVTLRLRPLPSEQEQTR